MSNTLDIEKVLDFSVHIGREMLESGSNLERVTISIQRICKIYNLREVSIFVLNSWLTVSAKNLEGNSFVRQASVPMNGIHLARLRRLNDLVHKIMKEKPEPEKLTDMLYEAIITPSYSNGILILGYVIAMICLCRIFGGVWQDMIVVVVNTIILYFITMIFSREKLNRIISNIIAMFLCGCVAIFCTNLEFAKHLDAIIITNAFYLIPGIPMVNAVRNIICGNEMNGIIEMVKVILEVVTIVAGLYIACLCFGTVNIAF